MNICRQGYRSGNRCANAPISLYKHRLSMPRSSVQALTGTGDCKAKSGYATANDALAPHDTLAAFTEEAAVGMQLLSMRAQAGHSRFVLLLSRPEAEEQDIDNEVLDAESLEIRIMAAEVLLMGPVQHRSTGDAQMAAKSVTPLRAAKVCFRRSPCVSP